MQNVHAALESPHPIELLAQTRHGPLGHRLEICQPLLCVGGLTVSLEPLTHDGPVRSQPLGLAGGLEHVPALREAGFRPKPRVASLGQIVAVLFELLESCLAGPERHLGSIDGLVRDLQPPRVLGAGSLEGPDGIF